MKGEGKEEKISFGISDIQISIYYDLIVRKIIPVVISGNWTWTDLMVKGGATIKPCGGSPCRSGYNYCCFPDETTLAKKCWEQSGMDKSIGDTSSAEAGGATGAVKECMDANRDNPKYWLCTCIAGQCPNGPV